MTEEAKVTSASIIRAGLEAEHDNEAITAAVLEVFPGKKNIKGLIKYYRTHPLKRAAGKVVGEDAPADGEAETEAETTVVE